MVDNSSTHVIFSIAIDAVTKIPAPFGSRSKGLMDKSGRRGSQLPVTLVRTVGLAMISDAV